MGRAVGAGLDWVRWLVVMLRGWLRDESMPPCGVKQSANRSPPSLLAFVLTLERVDTKAGVGIAKKVRILGREQFEPATQHEYKADKVDTLITWIVVHNECIIQDWQNPESQKNQ
jgi:hypothetical protein